MLNVHTSEQHVQATQTDNVSTPFMSINNLPMPSPTPAPPSAPCYPPRPSLAPSPLPLGAHVQDFGSQKRLDTNDSLRLASTWHGLHAIAMQVTTAAHGSVVSGWERLEAAVSDWERLGATGSSWEQPGAAGSGCEGLGAAVSGWGRLGVIVSGCTKFFIATEVGFTGAPTLLAIIYDLYTDYVLKNLFYEVPLYTDYVLKNPFYEVPLYIDYVLKNPFYEVPLYTGYVLKNLFYEVKMPIRCDLFDLHLPAAIRKDCSLLATTGVRRIRPIIVYVHRLGAMWRSHDHCTFSPTTQARLWIEAVYALEL
ncbi:unnamed protein product [Closterium sp. NIES-64]|nr:unnamed protein product [Closterium sp. NIES-64]